MSDQGRDHDGPLRDTGEDLGARLQRALGDAFRVESELGGGGMSRVFLVQDIDLDRLIVVKVLPPELAAGLSVDRFRREIQLAAKLQHPHIVPLLTAGARDGLLYFAMPYINGEALRTRLARQHELPIGEAVRILRDVVDALSHAHAAGIVHRDIKPDNVLLSGHHAMVTDFGVSKALENSTGESSLTSVGIALGTPAYMSPEQAAADPAVDHRSDIYSVGALAYELLTGRPPFTGLSPHQVLAAHVTTSPEPVTSRRQSISPQLGAVVMRCLEKRPADRWQSADDLLACLEALATPSGGMTPSGMNPHVKRHRWPAATIAAAVGALLVVGAGVWWMLRPAPGYVVASTAQVTNTPGLELDAALSPDGSVIAFSAGPVGRMKVFIRQIGGGAARALVDSGPEPQRSPRWTADGQQVTFVSGQALYAAPALGGTPRLLYDASGYEFASPALSPDGSSVAFARQDGIYSATLGGSGTAPVKVVSARWPSWIVWSPDGRHLAYVTDNPWYVYSSAMLGNIAPSAIWVANVAARSAAPVTDAAHLNASPVWRPDGRGLLFASSLGGGRDIYQVALDRAMRPSGRPARLTTGANVHTIALAASGTRLAYTALTTRSNIWTAPIRPNGVTSFSEAKSLTNENQSIEGLSVSPDGAWLAYDSNRDGPQHIYKVSTAGGSPLQLTRDSSDDFNPSWSGDGRFIAYHSLRSGNRDIYVMSATGADAHDVTGYAGHEMGPSVSHDGSRIMFIADRSGRWELYSIARKSDGSWGAPAQLTKDFGYRGRWSPDGQTVVYVSLVDTTVHLVASDGRGSRLLFDGHRRGVTPQNVAFGQDGGSVYFSAIDARGTYGFYAISAAGGEPRALLAFDDPLRQPRRPEFDTGGGRLFFTIASDESDVWVMELKR